jgi:hypothetical protein
MKKLIGISAGRENKVSEKAVRFILNESNLKYDFYSLSSFEILTCDACNGCIETYRCVKDDKINEIISDLKQADGLVFAAPEYWDGMNGKGRAFWERVCFSTRHNSNFPFKNLKGIILGISGDGDSVGVINDIENFYKDARIDIIDKVKIQGEYACFTCGYGDKCPVGGLANLYNLPIEISEKVIPGLCNQHPEGHDQEDELLKELKNATGKLINEMASSDISR